MIMRWQSSGGDFIQLPSGRSAWRITYLVIRVMFVLEGGLAKPAM
jgi:hypothetical protein